MTPARVGPLARPARGVLPKGRAVAGGLHVIAEVIHLDQEAHGRRNDPVNMALRRYAGMAMTNLTYGDVVNKVTRLAVHHIRPSSVHPGGFT